MYLRVTSQRRPDGTALSHLQIVESVWNKEKKRNDKRIIYNCGRADDPEIAERMRRLARSILRRCAPDEIIQDNPTWKLEDAWPYGDIYVLEAIWQRLGIPEAIAKQSKSRKLGFAVERALFAMVANRACAPASKLYCYEQWLRDDVHIDGAMELGLQHLYRAMDFLEANKDAIEKEIFFRTSSLLNLDVDVVFYDTTSLHFEIDEQDEGGGEEDLVRGSKDAGGKTYKAPRKRGHSKNGRGDVPQIVVGLAVTRDGLPVRHWIFPGNTVDVTTVAKVKEDLRGWQLSRCLFVGDGGMVSEANLKTLRLGGGKYIVCMPMRRGDEVTKQVLTRPGRFKRVAENLRVKEVTIGDGERRRRYVVCHNPEEERRQRRHRAKVLEELKAELASLQALDGGGHTKRVCRLRASGRYGRYVCLDAKGQPKIDRAKVKDEERVDGKFVVHSNDDTLTSEDMALGYKQLMRVEEAWRTLKSGLKMRPVFHWAPHRIHAHVALTVLALLLERVIERACEDTWRNIRDDLRQIKLAQLLSPNGEVWQVTEPGYCASNRLETLKIKAPGPILRAH
jgi:hypothetical protein